MNKIAQRQPFIRREDERLISGRRRYVDDISHPETLRVVFVRSPYAAATSVSVDVQSARQYPGVAAVLTAADMAADGHKWLLGPEGAGIFYLRRELLNLLHPVGVGWNSVVGARDFSRIDFTLKPHAGRWESGTLNVAGITGLGASLELLLEIGVLCRGSVKHVAYRELSPEKTGIETAPRASRALNGAARLARQSAPSHAEPQ